MTWIGESCVGCSSCVSVDPTIFEIKEGVATIIKEPTTQEEIDNYNKAKDVCPTHTIE